MSQTASPIPPKNGIGTLQLSDFWKSLLIAALSNVLLSLYSIINTGNFPTHADLIVMLKSTIAIVISYILKNLGTNNVGQFLSKDKPVIAVDKQYVENLKDKAAQADEAVG